MKLKTIMEVEKMPTQLISKITAAVEDIKKNHKYEISKDDGTVDTAKLLKKLKDVNSFLHGQLLRYNPTPESVDKKSSAADTHMDMKLKTIIENAGIGGYGDKPEKMTPEQKKQLLQMVNQYNECGKTLYEYGDIRQLAEKLLQVADLAEKYALEECNEDFLQVGNVQKHMKEIKRDASDMHKIAKEAWMANERMKACYEGIGKKLEMYYELN